MDGNIRVGILTESEPLTAAVERSLRQDSRLEVRCLDPQSDDLRAPDDLDVLLVSSSLPRGGALRLLGRSWTIHRFPRLLFLHGRRPAAGATLTRRCAAELADRAEAAARRRGPMASRVPIRFLEPESGVQGSDAVAAGG